MTGVTREFPGVKSLPGLCLWGDVLLGVKKAWGQNTQGSNMSKKSKFCGGQKTCLGSKNLGSKHAVFEDVKKVEVHPGVKPGG